MKMDTLKGYLEKKDVVVVYEVPCTNCDTTYIDETGRDLKKRIVEHKYAVRRKDDKNKIVVHANSHNHGVDREGAKVPEQKPWYWKKRILETIYIQK